MQDNSVPETKTRYNADELRALPIGTEYWPSNGMGYMKNRRGQWLEISSGPGVFTSNDVAAIHPAVEK